MATHYIEDEADEDGWIVCDCGKRFPTREKHDTHRYIEKARQALREGIAHGA